MTETELENFTPRNAIILLGPGGNSVTWSVFNVGSKDVKRITVNEYGLVRVEFTNGKALRAMGSDWSGWEVAGAPVAAVSPPKAVPPPMQKQGARR